MLLPYSFKRQTFRARWILPVEGPPIADGTIVIEDGKIAFIGPGHSTAGEMHEVAILPAFINAHTHLEFSSLSRPIGDEKMEFTEWIREVIRWRRSRDADEANATRRRREAITAGILESVEGGAGCLGEIATSNQSWEALSDTQTASVVFWELIGLSQDRISPVLEQLNRFLQSSTPSPDIRRGISPHAPYTVHPDLLKQAVQLSAKWHAPLSMHLAETREELQLLESHDGPFFDFLSELGAWYPDAIPRHSRPLDYLQRLAAAERVLVIHGNYLNEDEHRFLAGKRDRMSLVYCPRTHSYFGHAPYPLRKLLDLGVHVAIGTDSKASNPDLKMLEELRFAVRQHPQVSPEELLRIATIDSARALGVDSQLGSLRVGKQARLQFIDLPAGDKSDPYSWLN